LIAGFKGSSATETCSVDSAYFDNSSQGTSSPQTLAATANEVGDLVIFADWCPNGCTYTTTPLGRQTATQTSVSGNSSSSTGQPFLAYILSSTTAGAQTITWTASGSPGEIQTAYYDFTPSAGCTFTHDVDSTLGTGTGTAVNTPSITPTTGDLLFNFTVITQHMTAIGSPWLAWNYYGSGETSNQFFTTTVNADAYVLSASSGSTTNNMTQNASNPWQGLITSFKLAISSGAVVRHRGAVINQ